MRLGYKWLCLSKASFRFDQKLVQHTFAYITAAKSGISETELEDVLSLDDRWDLLSGFF